MKKEFQEVVNTIRDAEKDVDKVLDAARLKRTEGPDRYMTGEEKYNLLLVLILVIACLIFFALLFLS